MKKVTKITTAITLAMLMAANLGSTYHNSIPAEINDDPENPEIVIMEEAEHADAYLGWGVSNVPLTAPVGGTFSVPREPKEITQIQTLPEPEETIVEVIPEPVNVMEERYWYIYDAMSSSSTINGVTEELIEYVDTVCATEDVNPHWMWMIYDVESELNCSAINKWGSGARGLGQVLPSTGKYIWEGSLGHGRGSFYTDLLFDPYVNVEISVRHIADDLRAGHSMRFCIQHYCGGNTNTYVNECTKAATEYGVTLTLEECHYPYYE